MYVPSSELGLPQPLSRKRVCPPPPPRRPNGGGAHSPAAKEVGESQFRRPGEKLSALPRLWPEGSSDKARIVTDRWSKKPVRNDGRWQWQESNKVNAVLVVFLFLLHPEEASKNFWQLLPRRRESLDKHDTDSSYLSSPSVRKLWPAAAPPDEWRGGVEGGVHQAGQAEEHPQVSLKTKDNNRI